MKMTIEEILADIKSDRVKKVVIDTDTYNEIDDQYALAYTYLSPKMKLVAVHACPFENEKSDNYGRGMELSYNEAIKTLKLTDPDYTVPVFRGSTEKMEENGMKVVESEACDNLIKVVKESDEIVYVLAIGAITNVVSSIMKDPSIIDNMCVIWLAGTQLDANNLGEFNLVQDYTAGQLLLNSGVPLLLCPAWSVVSELSANFDCFRELQGHNAICDYLFQITEEVYKSTNCRPGWIRTIWDIAAPAIIEAPECAEIEIIPTPIFTDERVYAFDSTRHKMMYLKKIHREIVFDKAWATLKSAGK